MFVMPSRILVLAGAIALICGAGSAGAQVTPIPAPTSATGTAAPAVAPPATKPQRTVAAGKPETATTAQASKDAVKQGIADCLRLWDAGTHMTKQQWAATCKRIQTRLDSIRAETIEPKRPNRRQGSSR